MFPAENLNNKIKKFWPKNGPQTQKIEKYVKKYSKEKIVIKCGAVSYTHLTLRTILLV